MLQEETGIKGRMIDDVRVLEDFSFVTVPFEEAEIILQLFSKKKTNGRSLVSKAKDKKSDSSARRSERPRRESSSHFGRRDEEKRKFYKGRKEK